MLICINGGVMSMKPEHQTTGNVHVIWSCESSFKLLLTSGKVYVWKTPKVAYNPECLVPTGKYRDQAVTYIRKSLRLENTQGSLQSRMPGSNREIQGRFCDGLGRHIMVHYSVAPIITLNG
jgi:hypothetical protein